MWETIVTALVSSAVASGVLGAIGKVWLESRLKASIEHEYKKQFEIFTRELNRKEKVELVAELMAEYMKTPYGEKLERDQRLLLNKLSFKASLWLPAELAVELGKRLQNKKDAKSAFELLLVARRLLIGEGGIAVGDITWWDPGQETRIPPMVGR